jgi:hypothetical protein
VYSQIADAYDPDAKECQSVVKLKARITTYLGNRILFTVTDGHQPILNNMRGVAGTMTMTMTMF